MKWIAAAVVVTAVLACGLAPAAHAQPVMKAEALRALPKRGAAPRALTAKARLARVNKALVKVGLGKLTAVKAYLDMRVTPVAPQWAANAKITAVGATYFDDADAEAPHGSYLLTDSVVRMTFPTEVGKLYILDCRLAPLGSSLTATVGREGASDVPLPVEDGHLLHVFQAGAAQTKLHFEVRKPGGFWASAYFYGCDFGKAN